MGGKCSCAFFLVDLYGNMKNSAPCKPHNIACRWQHSYGIHQKQSRERMSSRQNRWLLTSDKQKLHIIHQGYRNSDNTKCLIPGPAHLSEHPTAPVFSKEAEERCHFPSILTGLYRCVIESVLKLYHHLPWKSLSIWQESSIFGSEDGTMYHCSKTWQPLYRWTLRKFCKNMAQQRWKEYKNIVLK